MFSVHPTFDCLGDFIPEVIMSNTKVVVETPRFIKGRFAAYKNKVNFWKGVCGLTKKKQAGHLALVLPNDLDDPLQDQVMERFTSEELEVDDGVQILLDFLEKKYGKDELLDCLDKYKDFRDFVRTTETITEYISNFDIKYNRISKLGVTLPPSVLAFELIRNANVKKDEEKLVLTGLDFSKKAELFDMAKLSLRKFLGEGCSGGASGPVIKQEPVFWTRNEDSSGDSSGQSEVNEAQIASEDSKYEEAYIAGYNRAKGFGGFGNRGVMRGSAYLQNQRGRAQNYRGSYNWQNDNTRRSGYDGGRGTSWRGTVNTPAERLQRPLNPPGQNGEPISCRKCGSYRHLTKFCKSTSANINVPDPNGQPYRCNSCGSFQHFLKDCTESWEYINSRTSKINICDYVPGSQSPYDDQFQFDVEPGKFDGTF